MDGFLSVRICVFVARLRVFRRCSDVFSADLGALKDLDCMLGLECLELERVSSSKEGIISSGFGDLLSVRDAFVRRAFAFLGFGCFSSACQPA